ncbi:MAG: hypothetical protein AAB074_11790 [Planctomycetota bacterium]
MPATAAEIEEPIVAAPSLTPTTCAGSTGAALGLSGLFFVVYAAYALIHRGSAHQDAANHFGYARDGLRSLSLLLDPWGRPLWSVALCLPAQGGLMCARIFCALFAAWGLFETWRLARIVIPHAALLAIPAMGLQFHFFALAGDNMTEPLFALVFAVAYRKWLEGKLVSSLLLASLLPLARPEGFFLGVLWGCFVLASALPAKKKLTYPLLLLAGTVAWSLGGLVADGDILFIKHHWPGNWVPGDVYGRGRLFHYVVQWPMFTGAAFLLPFLAGLWAFASGRPRIHVVTFAFFFLLHTVLWWKGLFGSIGYLRYFVCIAPLLALFTAEGMRFCAAGLAAWRVAPRVAYGAILAGAFAWSAVAYEAQGDVYVFKAFEESEDLWRAGPAPRTVADSHARHTHFPPPYGPLQPPTQDVETQIKVYAGFPAGTRILWDDRMGGGYYAMGDEQFEAAGYRVAARRKFEMGAYRPAWYRGIRGLWKQAWHPQLGWKEEWITITVYEKR